MTRIPIHILPAVGPPPAGGSRDPRAHPRRLQLL